MPMNDVPCPNCGGRCFPEEKICPSCGIDIDQAAAEIERQIPARRYPALRVIAGLYQIIAVVIALLALIGLLIGFQQSAGTQSSQSFVLS
jgi:uncharacterized membrane protein YvbJ